MRKLLGDSPRAPRFIETLPKRGYRMICSPVLASSSASTEADELVKKGLAFRYPRTCLHRPQAETDALRASGAPFAVRFKMPDDHIRFTDIVRGAMDFPPESWA